MDNDATDAGTPAEIRVLLQILDEAYERPAWHGPNLRGSIRRLSTEEAAWRPAPNQHNIWELVLHAAYWKYVVRRRLLGDKRGSFPRRGSDWFVRPGDAGEGETWQAAVSLLDEMHRTMRDAVAGLAVAALWETPPGSTMSNFTLITGVAAHDVYHAGQVQTLRHLYRAR